MSTAAAGAAVGARYALMVAAARRVQIPEGATRATREQLRQAAQQVVVELRRRMVQAWNVIRAWAERVWHALQPAARAVVAYYEARREQRRRMHSAYPARRRRRR